MFRFDFEIRATISFGVLDEVRLGLSKMIKGSCDQLGSRIFVFKYLINSVVLSGVQTTSFTCFSVGPTNQACNCTVGYTMNKT